MLNRIKRALAEGNIAIGVHCPMTDLMFYEIAGKLGYDFVWIEGEHTNMTGPMTSNAILATQSSGAAAFPRVAWNDPVLAKPILEAGADGIIFPMVNTAEEAKRAVSACYYPPFGTRGFGPARSMDFGLMPLPEYMEKAKNDVWCMIQIETKTGVENLDEILKVEGINAVLCGAMDLSLSVNKLGQMDDPEVAGLLNTIGTKCRQAGIPFGISTAGDHKLLRTFLDMGASIICLGSPDIYFAKGCREALNQYRPFKVKTL